MIQAALSGGDYDAVTFDCYGTLIDWEAGCLRVMRPWADGAGLAAGDDELLWRFAEAQRHQQCIRPARPYREVLGGALEAVAEHFAVRLQPAVRRRFAASVGDWPPFPDTVQALARLAGRFRLGVLSNVDNRSFAETRRLTSRLHRYTFDRHRRGRRVLQARGGPFPPRRRDLRRIGH